MDIVERLRDYMEGSGGFRVQLCTDAADEIERLRAALTDIGSGLCSASGAAAIAKNALAGKSRDEWS